MVFDHLDVVSADSEFIFAIQRNLLDRLLSPRAMNAITFNGALFAALGGKLSRFRLFSGCHFNIVHPAV
jgi:hypothetical protein